MSTWGTGIFEDDLAADIRDAFQDDVESGKTSQEATNSILQKYQGDLQDIDLGPVIYLALAQLQLDAGPVDKDLLRKVLEIIDTESSLDRWREVGGDELAKRKDVLNKLGEALRSSSIA